MQDLLALLALISFALGVACASIVIVPHVGLYFLLLLALVCFGAWFFARKDWYLIPSLFLLFLAFGIGRVMLTPQELPHTFEERVGTKVTLVGTIASDPDIRETTQRITVRIQEGSEHTKVLVVTDRYTAFSYGDQISVEGMLTRPKPFETDGGREFAYDQFLAKDGIFSMINFARVEKTGMTDSLLMRGQQLLYEGKHQFAKGLEASLSEPHASLAEGLLAGGKQGLGKSLLDAFTITGLLPIIVLSGYNVMIVAEAILIGFSFLRKRHALVLATLTIILFILAAGGGSSAVRAGLMAGLALFARMTGRTYDALRALAATFVILLLYNPLLLIYDPGFQFSFAATLGLIVASPLFGKRLLRIRMKSIREVLSTTLAAQLFVLPLLLYQTGNLSLVAIPANILVLPVIPFAMAFAAIAGVVGILVPLAAPFFGLPAYALLSYVIGVAESASHIPFAHVIIPLFSAVFLLVAYSLIAVLVVRLQKSAASTAALPTP
ncbi:MAG: ComEC/Rec2 family competence protein [Patescibacteria group bacterium]